MFRDMRRKGQALPAEDIIAILESSPTGVLGVTGEDGYPYTVPLNFHYQDGKLFFHCAREGHKLDGIRKNDKVSFCVVGKDTVVPRSFATNYRSVIIFGRARIINDDEGRRSVLQGLIDKYSPGLREEGEREIEKDWDRVCIVEVRVVHMTGKAAQQSVQDADS
jgi:nitroimidazol reductase NimA-like FMN-containing flavoprotein (pyridoxamine 5'-phosphate oxidase superfamily)